MAFSEPGAGNIEQRHLQRSGVTRLTLQNATRCHGKRGLSVPVGVVYKTFFISLFNNYLRYETPYIET